MRRKRETKWTGEKIEALRHRYKQTQTEFGNVFSVAKSTVCQWEKGRLIPRDRKLQILDRLEDDIVSGRVVIPETPKPGDAWKNASAKQCVG